MIAMSKEFPMTENSSRTQYRDILTPLLTLVSLSNGLQLYSSRIFVLHDEPFVVGDVVVSMSH